MDQVEEVKGVKLLATSIEDVDMNGLRELGDNLKEKLGEGVIVLASQKDGKVFLVAMVTDEAQKAGAHAGNLIKAIAGCVGWWSYYGRIIFIRNHDRYFDCIFI